MLVLGRYLDQRIVIDGGRIILTVVDIQQEKVRLGFEADPGIVIDREEIHEAKRRGEGKRPKPQ